MTCPKCKKPMTRFIQALYKPFRTIEGWRCDKCGHKIEEHTNHHTRP